MPRVKRTFSNELYARFFSFVISDSNQTFIEDKSHRYDILAKSARLKMMLFVANEHVYLFEVDMAKGKADIHHICEDYLYSDDREEFINNLRAESYISDSAHRVILGKITESEYPLELMKESEYIAKQREQILDDLAVFKVLQLIDDSVSRQNVVKLAKERAFKLAKDMGLEI